MCYMNERKDAFLIVRLTQFEKNEIESAADMKGISMSDYVREILEPYIQND